MTGFGQRGRPATGHVFHESNVAGSKHLPGAITGANLDFAGKMHDQPAFGKRVEVPLSGTVKLLHPDLVYIGQCAQFRVLLQTPFLDMAFTVAPRKNSLYSHSAPPQSIARLLRSGLRLVRRTISSAQNALACHNEGIVASGRRIVHRYSSGKSRAASGRVLSQNFVCRRFEVICDMISFGQKTQTHHFRRVYAPTATCSSPCNPPYYDPYSLPMSGNGGDGMIHALEAAAGVYHGLCR